MFEVHHLLTGDSHVLEERIAGWFPNAKTYRTHNGGTLFYTGEATDDQLEEAAQKIIDEESDE